MSVNVYIAAGRPADPDFDFASTVATILASGYAAYFPGHLDRAYKLGTVTLASHARIIADREAVIEGLSSSNPLFASSGSVRGIRIAGGRWGGGDTESRTCSALWQHTGSSQASDCVVEGVSCEAMNGPAVDLSACVHCRLDGWVQDADYGFALGGTSVANSNRVRLRALRVLEAAVWLRGSTTRHRSNVIEHLTADTGGRALLVDGYVSGLRAHIDSEPAAGTTYPDVEINAPANAVTGVEIGGFFATMRAGQSERIKVTGNAGVTVRDLQVYVRVGGFAVNTTSSRTLRTSDVEILDLAARTYADVLTTGVGTVEILREPAA